MTAETTIVNTIALEIMNIIIIPNKPPPKIMQTFKIRVISLPVQSSWPKINKFEFVPFQVYYDVFVLDVPVDNAQLLQTDGGGDDGPEDVARLGLPQGAFVGQIVEHVASLNGKKRRDNQTVRRFVRRKPNSRPMKNADKRNAKYRSATTSEGLSMIMR